MAFLLIATRTLCHVLIALIILTVASLSGFYIDHQIILVSLLMIVLLALSSYAISRKLKSSYDYKFMEISPRARLYILCAVGLLLIGVNLLIHLQGTLRN